MTTIINNKKQGKKISLKDIEQEIKATQRFLCVLRKDIRTIVKEVLTRHCCREDCQY